MLQRLTTTNAAFTSFESNVVSTVKDFTVGVKDYSSSKSVPAPKLAHHIVPILNLQSPVYPLPPLWQRSGGLVWSRVSRARLKPPRDFSHLTGGRSTRERQLRGAGRAPKFRVIDDESIL